MSSSLRVLALVFAGFLSWTLPAASQDVRLASNVKSGPTCGGGVVDGKVQPECQSTLNNRASYVGPASGKCPATNAQGLRVFGDALGDLASGSCWSCPAGYERSLAAVSTERACFTRDKTIVAQEMAKLDAELAKQGRKRTGEHIAAQLIKKVQCGSGTSTIAGGAWGRDTFWDAIEGGSCWQCPNGFGRTAEHIGHANACSQGIFGPFARARMSHKNHCEAGEVHDPRNGGECWKCPATYDRTVFAVTGPTACEKQTDMVFTKAKSEGVFGCAAGQHLDLIAVSGAEINELKKLGLVKSEIPAPAGPSCWSCPPGYKRTIGDVRKDGACSGTGMEWRTAPFPEPGLFGLAGASEVALALVNQRTGIEAAIAQFVKVSNPPLKLEDARRLFWDEIAKEPENSPILKAAVFTALVAAIEDPAGATAAEKQLMVSFADYMRKRKIYVAEDAIAALNAWVAADKYYKSVRQNKGPANMTDLIDTGVVPPDFHDLMESGYIAAMLGGGALSSGYSIAMSHRAVHYAIFPARKVRADMLRRIAKIEKEVTEEVVEQVSTKVSKHLAKTTVQQGISNGLRGLAKSLQAIAGGLKALASAGPQIIITAAVEAITETAEKQIDIQNAGPTLQAKLQTASLQIDLFRLLGNDGGYEEVQSAWALGTSTGLKPTSSVAFDFSKAASTALAAVPAVAVAAVKPAAAAMASAAPNPAAMPKYFNGVQAMGPFVWQDGPAAIAAGLRGAVIGGQEGNRLLPLCRAAYQNSVHPGKLVDKACNIGWGGKEMVLTSGFQVLVRATASQNEQYFPVDNWRAPNELPPASTFFAGYEGQNWMRVCRAQHNGAWHPGKEVAGRCNIGWGGKEIVLQQYQVLSLFNTAAGGNRNGN